VVSEKRGHDFFFVELIENGFVPATHTRVFDALKGSETERCPFANLPEKRGAHRTDRDKMKTVRWLSPR
jgi:hypothetical protein